MSSLSFFCSFEFALLPCRYYLSLTGDFDFLHETVTGAVNSVLEVMPGFATAYKNLTVSDGGLGAGACLADYGLAANLLECVPTYQHRVASFNAATVWMLEQVRAALTSRSMCLSHSNECAAKYDILN